MPTPEANRYPLYDRDEAVDVAQDALVAGLEHGRSARAWLAARERRAAVPEATPRPRKPLHVLRFTGA